MNGTASAHWWVPGDWNGFFWPFHQRRLNVIVLTGLCLHVVNLRRIVYRRILPHSVSPCRLAILYYAYSAGGSARTKRATT